MSPLSDSNAGANAGANADVTCWTLINGAAAGRVKDRDEFARRYVGVVRAYLVRRWRGSRLREELDDAVQEVFVECFRQDGVLDRIREERPASFRGFLYGVTRNVALRCERRIGQSRERPGSNGLEADAVESDEATLSRVFDRAWARALMRQAATVMEKRARLTDERARRRVEILRLRSRESLPIREIARRWDADAAFIHKEYARAREEFRVALGEVVAFHHPGCTDAEVAQRCVDLIGLLGG